MSGRRLSSRFSEKALRAAFGARAQEKPSPGEVSLRSRYERIFQVSFRNSFYNGQEDQCADIIAQPTTASRSLMRSIGLLFKQEATGFSVLYNRERKREFLSFLRRQAQGEGEPGGESHVWTRLSFTLNLTNPYFVNFTRLPIRFSPSATNYFFTNQEAYREDHKVILNPGGPGDWQLLPVIPVQVPVAVSEQVYQVEALSLSGQQVLCKPRCVSAEAAQESPASLTCADSVSGGEYCAKVLYLDFSSLPEDKYTLAAIDEAGNSVENPCCPESTSQEPCDVLYTYLGPMPFGFIDLLFTDPSDASKGIFPVRNLFPEEEEHTAIVPVNYFLEFEARKTCWRYYILPLPGTKPYVSLRIESHSIPPVEFEGPKVVRLSNGEFAQRFRSKRSLQLQEQPEIELTLRGKRTPQSPDQILLSRMPAASNQQVLPEVDPLTSRKTNFSDIYVYV